MSDERRGSSGGWSVDVHGGGRSRLVYPVMSRRSGGLSLGIDLFPLGKVCSFDCPYCEVFAEEERSGSGGGRGDPGDGRAPNGGSSSSGPDRAAARAATAISIDRLESELADFADRLWPESFAPEPVRDICFSGNGEPSLSPSLEPALAVADRARRLRPNVLGPARLVLITNSTGFLDESVSSFLVRAVDDYGLEIWAKLDAGSEDFFRLMSGTTLSLSLVAEGILRFARLRPVIIQSMFCTVDGRSPSEADAAELGRRIAGLVAKGARIREVHAYTFARPSPSGVCSALGDAYVARLAAEVAAASGLTVRAFGSRGELGTGRRVADADASERSGR